MMQTLPKSLTSLSIAESSKQIDQSRRHVVTSRAVRGVFLTRGAALQVDLGRGFPYGGVARGLVRAVVAHETVSPLFGAAVAIHRRGLATDGLLVKVLTPVLRRETATPQRGRSSSSIAMTEFCG